MIKQRSLVTYILLTFLTCGIYSIFFWYSYTEDVNRMCSGDGEESMNYILVLLLSFVTCGIYGLYWFYKQANRLKRAGARYGVVVTEGGGEFLMWYLVGCLLCFIGSLLSFNILIKNANIIADAYNGRNGGMPMSSGGSENQREETVTTCYCAGCGSKMYVTDRFCPQCGMKNERAQAQSFSRSGMQGTSGTYTAAGINAASLKTLTPGRITAIFAAVCAVLFLINALWLNIGLFSGYIIFEYILPAVCMGALAALLFLGKEEYRQFETAALVLYFIVMFFASIRIYDIGSWSYYGALDNFCYILTAAGAAAAAGCLAAEFAGKRLDTVILIALAIIFAASMLTGGAWMLMQFRYYGFPMLHSFFTFFISIIRVVPALLYILSRNQKLLDNFKK